MAIINLRDFYYWYTQDEFVEVSDEMAAELFAARNSDKAHARRMRRNDVYSLDRDDGIEASAIICSTDNPEAIFDKMDQHCRLCRALNSLPEIQGKRIEAHYILGKTQRDIARAGGVNERRVRVSISKGLANMKKYLENSSEGEPICPQK